MMFGKNVAEMETLESGMVDRISELPEFILHNILSNLDTKEVYRASVLSKRWYEAWSSVPVLDFQALYYKKEYWNCLFIYGATVDDDEIQSFLEFIDRTMQRYNTRKYRIRELHLELPKADEKIEHLVDKWIRIAVQNQVEELHISTIFNCSTDTPYYRLPEILFRAKSLKNLNCRKVVLPYYETVELISLEYLTLDLDTVDADLLQRFISFCPLVELDITISYLGNISLPWERKVNRGAEIFGTEITQSKFKASPLRKFVYNGYDRVVTWPLNMNVVALNNLRTLVIDSATITDDIVAELANGLKALESLVLASCPMLKCIMISSISLKELAIAEVSDLVKITIDTPNLIKFLYCCEVETSLLLIRVLGHCNAQFSLLVTLDSISIDWLVKLKKILEETNFFQSLLIKLSNPLQNEVEEDLLRNVVTGPPYELGELKLSDPKSWDSIECFLMALDGLFWVCHPDVLSMTSTTTEGSSAEWVLNILKCKMQCWKHPLKSIEVEGIDGSSLHSDPLETEFRFRLSWL